MYYSWNPEVCWIYFSRYTGRKFEKLFSKELNFERINNRNLLQFYYFARMIDTNILYWTKKAASKKTFDKSKVQALSVGLMGNYTMSFADYGNLVSVTHLRSRSFLALQRVKLLPFISTHPHTPSQPTLLSIQFYHLLTPATLSVFERYWCDA